MKELLAKIDFDSSEQARSVYERYQKSSAWIDLCTRFDACAREVDGRSVTFLISGDAAAVDALKRSYSRGTVIFCCRVYAVVVLRS